MDFLKGRTSTASPAEPGGETQPKRRRNLDTVLAHMKAEAAGDLDGLMATITLRETRHYHAYGTDDPVLSPRGRVAAIDLRSLVLRAHADPAAMRGLVENDFEASVFRAHRVIGSIRDGLLESGAAFALMSGSGSSVFGLFPGPGAAERVAALFSGKHRVFLTPPGFVPDLRIGERRQD